MTKDRPTVEQLLARLDATTRAMRDLRDADGQPERALELVTERGWISRELAELAAAAPFSATETKALGEAIRGGESFRQTLVVRRETAREQVRELRGARRAQSGFQPYRETSGGHVTVDL